MNADWSKAVNYRAKKGLRLSVKKTVIFRQSRFILPAFVDRQKGRFYIQEEVGVVSEEISEHGPSRKKTVTI